MKTIIAISFIFSFSATANVKPVLVNNPTNDTYIGYQWSLNNQGQSVVRDIDDTHAVEILANPLANIGWSKDLDLMFKKDVIVAVVDSGVDYNHEDLKGHFALNEKECVDGKPSTATKTGDPDGNGFDGDCLGWNFVAPDQKRSRLTDDDIGHGTHISGIIASEINNAIGISGLSNRIKILPLKVYDSKEEGGSVTRRVSISERVAQAIDYAVVRKADVINLSLGWPIINNTQKVKDAINAALASGIVIVAGAGNDRHEAQIYPCAHPGVICVGSVDVDANVSRFSNYGGHVDILAPGGDILSTWPTLLSSQLFGPKGYEIRSGTSQAAPFVSGAAAILKGIYPNISNQELRARLLASAQASTQKSFTLKGLLNISEAVNLKNPQLVLPNFKSLDYVSVSPNLKFSLPVTIENLGVAQTVSVSVRSENAGIKLSGFKKTLNLAGNSSQVLNIEGQVNDINSSSTLRYEVEILRASQSTKYEHQIQIVRNIENDINVRSFVVDSNTQVNRLNLSSVRTYGVRKAAPEYWTSKKVDQGLIVSVYRLSKTHLFEAGSILLPNVAELLGGISVLRVDLNYDGKLDYLIGGLVRDDKGEIQALQYSYINSDIKEMFGSFSHMVLNYEGVEPSLKGLRFGQVLSKELGSVAVPVFFSEGAIPKADRNPDVFAFEVNSNGWRLYYLEPILKSGNMVLQTRSFFNYKSAGVIRRELELKSVEDLSIQNTFAQSEVDFNNGIIRVSASQGSGILRKYFVFNIVKSNLQNQTVEIVLADYGGIDLQKQGIDETLTIGSSDPLGESVGSNIVGIFSQTKARSVVLSHANGYASLASVIPFEIQDPFERVLGLVKTFEIDKDVLSFFESDTRLTVIGTQYGKPFMADSPIYRSSFLPGQYFTQRFFPMFVGNVEAKSPALYVDNTSLFAPTTTVWTLNASNDLISPIRLSFEIPKDCETLNPARFASVYSLALLCETAGQTTIKFVELK